MIFIESLRSIHPKDHTMNKDLNRRMCLPYNNTSYDSLHCKCCVPEVRQLKTHSFLFISRYKFKLRFGFNLKLYRGIWGSRNGGFRGCSIFCETCHKMYLRWRVPHCVVCVCMCMCVRVCVCVRVCCTSFVVFLPTNAYIRYVVRYVFRSRQKKIEYLPRDI